MLTLRERAEKAHRIAKANGFWEDGLNWSRSQMLILSELIEAMEEHRAENPGVYMTDHHEGCDKRLWVEPGVRCGNTRCKFEGVVVELADCAIRCLDVLGGLCYDHANTTKYWERVQIAVDERVSEPNNVDFVTKLRDMSIWILDTADPAVWEPGVVDVMIDTIFDCVDLTAKFYPTTHFWDTLDKKMIYNENRPYRHGKAY